MPRQRKEIDDKKLRESLQTDSLSTVAKALGCSPNTIRRRCREKGLSYEQFRDFHRTLNR